MLFRSTGWREAETFYMTFDTPADAERFLQQEQYRRRLRVKLEMFPKWVLKHSYMAPHKAYWEAWNTPYCCSPASETYWSM